MIGDLEKPLEERFQKPERIGKQKRRGERARKLTRAQCRAAVMLREKNRCQRCKRLVTDDCWPHEPRRAHVNELVPRSRGGDPLDPKQCELVCQRCHFPNGQHAPTPARQAAILARSKRRK